MVAARERRPELSILSEEGMKIEGGRGKAESGSMYDTGWVCMGIFLLTAWLSEAVQYKILKNIPLVRFVCLYSKSDFCVIV